VTSAKALEELADERLAVFWNEDGSVEVHGRLAPDEGAVFTRALDAARDHLWERERGSAEPRRPTKAEALAAMADLSLAATHGRSGGERYQVVVHVDEPALAGDGGTGREIEDGPAISAETARRLSCDASLVRIRERNGGPLDVGRKTRTIPPALRRALRRRDGGCCFPGCGNHRFVDAHHVRHWAKGGETSLRNLVLLCRRHHRLVREFGYSVDERMRFHDPRGRPIPAVPRCPPGDVATLIARKASIGPHTFANGSGERMNLALAVAAVVAADAQDCGRRGGAADRPG
jgi:hypothetical protein